LEVQNRKPINKKSKMGTQNRQPTLNEDVSEHEFNEEIQREMTQRHLLDLKNLDYLKSKLPK